jgi:hypothetical protein
MSLADLVGRVSAQKEVLKDLCVVVLVVVLLRLFVLIARLAPSCF